VTPDPTPSCLDSDAGRPEQPERRGSSSEPAAIEQEDAQPDRPLPPEIGGQQGPEPTRYGDWEKAGRCTDF
jgi:hypothetical protein